MARVYITHVTKEYLEIAKNLAISLRKFSNIPLIVYCVNINEQIDDFAEIENVYLRHIKLDSIGEFQSNEHRIGPDGNIFVERKNDRIYQILCAKTLAMESALDEGFEEVCYLDSDCIANNNVDDIFEWNNMITSYPLATEGIYEYVMVIENGVMRGNPFTDDGGVIKTLALEWPLMDFMGMLPDDRGTYRTTNIVLMNQKCKAFIKTWREFCFILPKITDTWKYAPFHEESIYNILVWKIGNNGLPLCYINIAKGLETIKHFYLENTTEGEYSDRPFYRVPFDKNDIKVFHGEKRTSEVNKILKYLM